MWNLTVELDEMDAIAECEKGVETASCTMAWQIQADSTRVRRISGLTQDGTANLCRESKFSV